MIGFNVYTFIMPAVKSIASAIMSGLFGILLGWVAIFLNRSLGYAWGYEVHLMIYLLFIGFGSGLGAYLPWINSEVSKYTRWVVLFIACCIGTVGAIAGYRYGLISDVEWLNMAFTIDFKTHRGGILFATVYMCSIGIYRELKN